MRRSRSQFLYALLVVVTFLIGLQLGRLGTMPTNKAPVPESMGNNAPLEHSVKNDDRSVAKAATATPPQPTMLTDSSVATEAGDPSSSRSRGYVQPLLPTHVLSLLNRPDSMLDLRIPHTFDSSKCTGVATLKDSTSTYEFLKFFGDIFREKFDNLPWWLDEGGLIGSSRAGALTNADDDFDFFAILPRQHAPCRADSLNCTIEEYQVYIHKFLMVFWNAGACINKFHPDLKRFQSRGRLMYSFQLNRREGPPEYCFDEGKPFAHMHLGMFTSDGALETNIWARHTTHPIDRLPLEVMLPVSRCRAGKMDAPCPRNVTEYLTIRNRGEYRKKASDSDGNCLLVKKRWKLARKQEQIRRTKELHSCGYNTLIDLVAPFEESNYANC